jgi:hypothetical protein
MACNLPEPTWASLSCVFRLNPDCMPHNDPASVPPAMVLCKRANHMSGGVAILIGLVFIGLHFSEPANSDREKHARHASLGLGALLAGMGAVMIGFTRVVEIQRRGDRVGLRRGWMAAGKFPIMLPHVFDAVEVRQRLPRFGGYLGMTSTIIWSVMLVDSASSAGGEVSDFQAKEPADVLCAKLVSRIRESQAAE